MSRNALRCLSSYRAFERDCAVVSFVVFVEIYATDTERVARAEIKQLRHKDRS